MRILEKAAVHYGIDNQFPYAVRRQLVDVLPVDSFNPRTQVDISQCELKRILNLLPKRPGIFPFINEDSPVFPFKHPALNL